jgi:hypothetical protein
MLLAAAAAGGRTPRRVARVVCVTSKAGGYYGDSEIDSRQHVFVVGQNP